MTIHTNEGVIDIEGWIKLYREIVSKDIYVQPPLYLKTFERLVIEANRSCKRIPYNKGTKLIKRGERLTSIRQIAEWVGWYERGIFKIPNPKTIANILDWLINKEMIEVYNKGNSQETHYNIVNYCVYQSKDGDESNAKVTVNGEVSIQWTDTNKKLKKDKNVKNKEYSSEIIQMADKLKFLILQNNPGAKTPTDLTKWQSDFDRMKRLDNRTDEQIFAVMEFSQKDPFWKANILSAGKLREKFDTLLLQKDRPKPQQKPTAVNKANFDQRKYTDEDFEKLYKV